MTLYLDTSALAKLYVRELGGDAAKRAVSEARQVAICAIGYVEMCSLLARRQREGSITQDDYARTLSEFKTDWPGFVQVRVSPQLMEAACLLTRSYHLRALDALHLAAVLTVGKQADDVKFLAFDDRLTQAARGLVSLWDTKTWREG